MKQLNQKQKEKFGKAIKDVRETLFELDRAFFPFCIAPDFVITYEQKNDFFESYEKIRKLMDEISIKTF